MDGDVRHHKSFTAENLQDGTIRLSATIYSFSGFEITERLELDEWNFTNDALAEIRKQRLNCIIRSIEKNYLTVTRKIPKKPSQQTQAVRLLVLDLTVNEPGPGWKPKIGMEVELDFEGSVTDGVIRPIAGSGCLAAFGESARFMVTPRRLQSTVLFTP
jgi:hypothetical protein